MRRLEHSERLVRSQLRGLAKTRRDLSCNNNAGSSACERRFQKHLIVQRKIVGQGSHIQHCINHASPPLKASAKGIDLW
jgi:hypothetical protein